MLHTYILFSPLVCFILFQQSFIHAGSKETLSTYCPYLQCWQKECLHRAALKNANLSEREFFTLQKTVLTNCVLMENNPLDIPLPFGTQRKSIRQTRRLSGTNCDYGHEVPKNVKFDTETGYQDCNECKNQNNSKNS